MRSGGDATRTRPRDADVEVSIHQLSGKAAAPRTHLEWRQASDLAAHLAEEVRMIVGHRPARIVEFIPPDSVAQVHTSDQVDPSEV